MNNISEGNLKKIIKITSPLKEWQNFTNEAESVVKSIVEKLLSLAFTKVEINRVNSLIPDYCFYKLKMCIDTFTSIQFIGYDRDDADDDVDIPMTFSKKSSGQKLKDKISFKDEEKGNKSETKIEKELSKLLDQARDSIDEDFKNIPNMNNVYTNVNMSNIKPEKIFYDTFFEGQNDWDVLPQPKCVVIDRDSSSVVNTVQEGIIPINKVEEEEKKEKKEKPAFKTFYFREKPKEQGKKKKQVLVEFPSYDIPPETLIYFVEPENCHQLREEVESERKQKELELKLKLKAQMEQEEKEKEEVKRQKVYDNKNITVDIKGNIIEIKPLTIDQLREEFTKANSKEKEVEIISPPSIEIDKEKIEVVKNSTMEPQPQKEKAKIKKSIQLAADMIKLKANRRASIEHNTSQKSIPLNNNISPPKKDMSQRIGEKPIILSGSNFDTIKLEVGVSILEDKRMKTGGKDFFQKYKRFSMENFEKQMGIAKKTVNKNVPTIIKNMKREEEEIITEKEEGNFYKSAFANIEPNAMNNTLHLKTKNLMFAVNNLDLIAEEDENAMKKQFNRTRPGDLFNAQRVVKTEGNYEDMTKFTRTLTMNSDWGSTINTRRRRVRLKELPKKRALKEIKNELNGGMRIPRKRVEPLPKIYSNNYNNGNDNRNFMTNTVTQNFFSRKKKKLSPLKDAKEDLFIKALEQDDNSDPSDNPEFAKTTTQNLFKKK